MELMALVATATDNENDTITRLRAAYLAREQCDRLYRSLCHENRRMLDTDRLIRDYLASHPVTVCPIGATGIVEKDKKTFYNKIVDKEDKAYKVKTDKAPKAKAEAFSW